LGWGGGGGPGGAAAPQPPHRLAVDPRVFPPPAGLRRLHHPAARVIVDASRGIGRARATYHRGMPRRLAAGSASDLVRAERDIRGRIGDQHLDFAAMAAVANIYRAPNVIWHHMEQKVLADEALSWAAFTVLFVLWIWGDQQTRHLADEAGVTKGTLTGVLKTLEKRGLTRRRAHDADGRLVLVSLESKGAAMIERLFPAFHLGEASGSSACTEQEADQLRRLLRLRIRSGGAAAPWPARRRAAPAAARWRPAGPRAPLRPAPQRMSPRGPCPDPGRPPRSRAARPRPATEPTGFRPPRDGTGQP